MFICHCCQLLAIVALTNFWCSFIPNLCGLAMCSADALAMFLNSMSDLLFAFESLLFVRWICVGSACAWTRRSVMLYGHFVIYPLVSLSLLKFIVCRRLCLLAHDLVFSSSSLRPDNGFCYVPEFDDVCDSDVICWFLKIRTWLRTLFLTRLWSSSFLGNFSLVLAVNHHRSLIISSVVCPTFRRGHADLFRFSGMTRLLEFVFVYSLSVIVVPR